ncbi:hypothetical protein CUMW_145880 [Citrus unshiu]|nr:hypothetical protein CUMW_145880 [Citrus unshiu]
MAVRVDNNQLRRLIFVSGTVSNKFKSTLKPLLTSSGSLELAIGFALVVTILKSNRSLYI